VNICGAEYFLLLLWSQSPKLHTMAASNNSKGHLTRSLYYCLFAPLTYVPFLVHIPFMVHRALNTVRSQVWKIKSNNPFSFWPYHENNVYKCNTCFQKVLYAFWSVNNLSHTTKHCTVICTNVTKNVGYKHKVKFTSLIN